MTKQLTRTERDFIAGLKIARRRAAFENCHFGNDKVRVVRSWKPESEYREETTDEFVKNRSRIYRETWLVPVLDALIEFAEGKLSKEQLAEHAQYWHGGA